MTDKLNQLAVTSDAKQVMYGHDLLNHLAPVVLHLNADTRIIPAEALSHILSSPTDLEGKHSLHCFCAHYLVQFHHNYSVRLIVQ